MILNGAALVAIADGTIHDKEQEMLDTIVKELEIPKKEANMLIEEMKKSEA